MFRYNIQEDIWKEVPGGMRKSKIIHSFYMNYTVTEIFSSLERPSYFLEVTTEIRISSWMKETLARILLAKATFRLA